jgi:AI-2 transport protein TqsA
MAVSDEGPGRIAPWKTGILIMTVIVAGFAAWALKSILAPFVLAVFLLLMIDGVARAIRDRIRGFPSRLAMPAAMILIVAFFLLTIWMVADNAAQFIGQTNEYEKRLNNLLELGAGRFGLKVTPTVAGLFQQMNPARFAGSAAKSVQDIASGAFVVLIYLGFLAASRGGFVKKGGKLFQSGDAKDEAERIFKRIREGVEGYVWVQTVAGLMIAVPAGVLMLALGLSHAIFWAFLIFVASYIPVIGGAIGTILPPIFALLEFPTLVQPIAIFAGLQLVGFVVGSVIQPRMQGTSLNVDPVVVFLGLAFWSLLWGLTGAFLSTPLTVMIMAICAQFASSRWIAVLLSSNGEPYPEVGSK